MKVPESWRDPWPCTTVARGDPRPSAGAAELAARGYRVIADVATIEADVDPYLDHLNNAAAARMSNELRVAYVAARMAPEWPRYLAEHGVAAVVRELHVRYDREVGASESVVGGTRTAGRSGKAVFVEQDLVVAGDGSTFAAVWSVLLLTGPGGVRPFPERFWEMVAAIEGGPVVEVPAPAARPPWGWPGRPPGLPSG